MITTIPCATPHQLIIIRFIFARATGDEVGRDQWMTFARGRLGRKKAQSDKDFQTRMRSGTYKPALFSGF